MATESDNVNAGALGTLLSVGAFATLGIALVVTALVRSEVIDETEKKDVGVDRPFRDLVAEQTAKLGAPAAYVDRGKGLVSLPIDRAMELTVAGLKRDPNSATPPPPPKDPAADAGGAPNDPASTPTDAAAPDAGAAPLGTEASKPAEAPAASGQADQPEAAQNGGAEPAGKQKPKKKLAPVPTAPVAPKPAPAAPVAPKPAPAAPVPVPPAAPAPNGQ